MKKIDMVKAASVAGTVLSVAATLLTGWASKKTLIQTVEKEVAKTLNK